MTVAAKVSQFIIFPVFPEDFHYTQRQGSNQSTITFLTQLTFANIFYMVYTNNIADIPSSPQEEFNGRIFFTAQKTVQNIRAWKNMKPGSQSSQQQPPCILERILPLTAVRSSMFPLSVIIIYLAKRHSEYIKHESKQFEANF